LFISIDLFVRHRVPSSLVCFLFRQNQIIYQFSLAVSKMKGRPIDQLDLACNYAFVFGLFLEIRVVFIQDDQKSAVLVLASTEFSKSKDKIERKSLHAIFVFRQNGRS
jgi:hypothetical protein